MAYFGLLNLHKPPAVTSRRVVDCVKRLVRPSKAGHAGTLDPLATGVLVVCVGPATRLIDQVQAMRKCYRGTFLLGRHSATEDIEGEVICLADPPQPSLADIQRAAGRFLGKIEQRPPAYSALKVAGQRSYDLARAGRAVPLAPRLVEIHRLVCTRYEYPELELEIECGSGTYVRSLGRDLAEHLGTATVMSALVRTAIGPFTLAEACDPAALNADNLRRQLISPLAAIPHLPQVSLTAEEVQHICNGRWLERPRWPAASEAAALDAQGRLVAILTPRSGNLWGARLNFVTGM